MKVYEILSKELPTDDPVLLMEMLAQSEALGDQVARDLRECEIQLSKVSELIELRRSNAIVENKAEKVAVMEARASAEVSEFVSEASRIEADMKYLKRVSAIVERRCSMGQSFLSHITAQVKAGIR